MGCRAQRCSRPLAALTRPCWSKCEPHTRKATVIACGLAVLAMSGQDFGGGVATCLVGGSVLRAEIPLRSALRRCLPFAVSRFCSASVPSSAPQPDISFEPAFAFCARCARTLGIYAVVCWRHESSQFIQPWAPGQALRGLPWRFGAARARGLVAPLTGCWQIAVVGFHWLPRRGISRHFITDSPTVRAARAGRASGPIAKVPCMAARAHGVVILVPLLLGTAVGNGCKW